ncbi:hypothetical protein EYE42_08825 [Paracoccus subflavus]|uniref:Uncharacterized protein n=1 Tax=Paracoccus subflavus TaxID=2528244 RepID=A0A4Q9G1X8_9RHOB|nr:hypothetical protein [Paracoccus subflavus]TBN40482.1 hypothetical protein EYE42_08825 [Paracoccus subflavus]
MFAAARPLIYENAMCFDDDNNGVIPPAGIWSAGMMQLSKAVGVMLRMAPVAVLNRTRVSEE